MLFSKRCPHTGVVNLYEPSEPLLPIGSIAKCGTRASEEESGGYAWHFFGLGTERSGKAPSVQAAEKALRALAFKTSVCSASALR